ncbi:MAG: hypothetical protein LBQ39_01620 [Tannerellaceae bacterium]|jgi:hypothetical protein|nr:hypothetical protein [Tannerellaceae bacterium]
METENNLGRLLALLLITLAMCLGLSGLPAGTLFGYEIKKIDLLSDIRIKEKSSSLDSLRVLLERQDQETDSVIMPERTALQGAGSGSAVSLVRDSLYNVMSSVQGADSAGIRIEDYSIGHTGLRRFFAALNNSGEMGRPVRIAFMGDSFIEGDIVVADFRDALQKRFGGHGVGFVPVTSDAAQFRPTIDQKEEGWTTYSVLQNRQYTYALSGMLFEAHQDVAGLSFKTVDRYAALKRVSSLKFLYTKSEQTEMQLVYHHAADTLTQVLPPTLTISQFVLNDTISEGCLTFRRAKGFRALGLALEDDKGVVVDNYSLRGNSGLLLEYLDPADCESLNKIRPYDLIILQYGLNVVNEEMLEYGWYRQRMVGVIGHIQRCFPGSDLLLLSVSDRAYQHDGEVSTMPAVLAMLHTQRQIARQTHIPFWNVFGAMGGENSMVRYVENNWASKDYTHLSFRGGREIAKRLMNALMAEKAFYDEAEKTIR